MARSIDGTTLFEQNWIGVAIFGFDLISID